MPLDKSRETAVPTELKSTEELFEEMNKAAPWLGEAVKKAMKGTLNERELGRVGEVLRAVASDIKSDSSELSELYIKTKDFERILEQILIQIADERHEEKRRLYQAFLSDAITSPCDPFQKQLSFLKILKELRLDQIKILTALATRPDTGVYRAQTPIQMLQLRLPDIHRDRLEGLLAQLQDLEIIRLADLHAAVAAGQPSGKCFTSLGRQLLRLLRPRS